MPREYIPWWLRRTGLEPTKLAIMVCLWSRRDIKTGLCWASGPTMATDLCINENTYWQHVKELEALGWLRRFKNAFYANSYLVWEPNAVDAEGRAIPVPQSFRGPEPEKSEAQKNWVASPTICESPKAKKAKKKGRAKATPLAKTVGRHPEKLGEVTQENRGVSYTHSYTPSCTLIPDPQNDPDQTSAYKQEEEQMNERQPAYIPENGESFESANPIVAGPGADEEEDDFDESVYMEQLKAMDERNRRIRAANGLR